MLASQLSEERHAVLGMEKIMTPVGIRIAAVMFSVAVWAMIITAAMHIPMIETHTLILALAR